MAAECFYNSSRHCGIGHRCRLPYRMAESMGQPRPAYLYILRIDTDLSIDDDWNVPAVQYLADLSVQRIEGKRLLQERPILLA